MFKDFEKNYGQERAEEIKAIAEADPKRFAQMWNEFRSNMHKGVEKVDLSAAMYLPFRLPLRAELTLFRGGKGKSTISMRKKEEKPLHQNIQKAVEQDDAESLIKICKQQKGTYHSLTQVVEPAQSFHL